MKINAIILSATFFIASAILINCKNIPANKVKDAKENVTEVKEDFTLENYKAEEKKEMACIQINIGKTATITENNYSFKK